MRASDVLVLHRAPLDNGPAYLKRTAYGIALVLHANRPEVALTLADGPEGAGIGWDLMRQTLGAGDRGLG